MEIGTAQEHRLDLPRLETLLHQISQLPKADLSDQLRPSGPDQSLRAALQPTMQVAQISCRFVPLKLSREHEHAKQVEHAAPDIDVRLGVLKQALDWGRIAIEQVEHDPVRRSGTRLAQQPLDLLTMRAQQVDDHTVR